MRIDTFDIEFNDYINEQPNVAFILNGSPAYGFRFRKLVSSFGSMISATVWCKRLLLLQQLNVCAMLEIIISVALYAAAIVFLVKSAFAYCNRSGHDIVTEP